MIEKKLKLGLLGTALEAQRVNYQENADKKIFIVPVNLNYNFVLEAPSLIKEYLRQKGRERYYVNTEDYTTSYKIFAFLVKFFTKQAEISVTIGHAMDLFGNYVNDDGESIGKLGKVIDPREYFMKNGQIVMDKQRDEEYTRLLSQRIVEEFHKYAEVLPSILIAFVAFEVLKKKFSKLDLYEFLRLPEDDLEIDYEEFKEHVAKAVEALKVMEAEGKLLLAPEFEKSIDQIVTTGIKNLGMYHSKRPLILNKEGNIFIQDLNLLYFYHNRLVGYNLEDYV